jgi:hypothetical protein
MMSIVSSRTASSRCVPGIQNAPPPYERSCPTPVTVTGVRSGSSA